MKKAQLSIGQLFLFIILGFAIIVLIGTFMYAFNTITSELLLFTDITGNVNISNLTSNTLGQINNAMLSHTDIIGLMILFGMAISMLFVAYLTRDSSPIIFFVFDIFILVFAYILSTYISNSYETILSEVPFSDIFITNLNLSTTLLLKLPLVVTVIGVMIMILSYVGIPKTKQEEVAGI